MRGTVTEDVITAISKLSKTNWPDIQKEIQAQEPTFDKWAKSSVKDNLSEIRFAGVVYQSEEATRKVGSVLLKAKLEGFLMALMSQDREWKDNLFINGTDKDDDVPFKTPIMAFLSGKLDEDIYTQLEKTMTEDEKKDPDNWKNKALLAFKENSRLKEASGKAKKFLKKAKPEKPDSQDDGDVSIQP